MKVRFLFLDSDFNFKEDLPWQEQILRQDLELDIILEAMSLGDELVEEAAKKILVTGTDDLETIFYRQEIVKDCMDNPNIVREMYKLAVDTVEARKKHHFGVFTRYPSSILTSSVSLLQMLFEMARELKKIARKNAHNFESRGFKNFFAMLENELDEAYFCKVQDHLKELKFKKGLLISAELGKGNVGTGYSLLKPAKDKLGWAKRMLGHKGPNYTFQIHPRDQGGHQALTELKNKGINRAANIMAQSAEHILGFFNTLMRELAFYIGCVNLYEQLSRIDVPVTIPCPKPEGESCFSFQGLYDPCLALTTREKVVGNAIDVRGKDLVMITGANQGGKTTFLRSVGLAQLMMHSGMFVPAEKFNGNISSGLFTHFRREEDSEMESGKLDEELSRMSDNVDEVRPGALVLLNESFASTNEREGSEIGRQVVEALVEEGVRVFYVTHLYELANTFYSSKAEKVFFLRAERKDDGKRTFKMKEGKPLQTSYGKDLYRKYFKSDQQKPVIG